MKHEDCTETISRVVSKLFDIEEITKSSTEIILWIFSDSPSFDNLYSISLKLQTCHFTSPLCRNWAPMKYEFHSSTFHVNVASKNCKTFTHDWLVSEISRTWHFALSYLFVHINNKTERYQVRERWKVQRACVLCAVGDFRGFIILWFQIRFSLGACPKSFDSERYRKSVNMRENQSSPKVAK